MGLYLGSLHTFSSQKTVTYLMNAFEQSRPAADASREVNGAVVA